MRPERDLYALRCVRRLRRNLEVGDDILILGGILHPTVPAEAQLAAGNQDVFEGGRRRREMRHQTLGLRQRVALSPVSIGYVWHRLAA
jgi:hypothetical protein